MNFKLLFNLLTSFTIGIFIGFYFKDNHHVSFRPTTMYHDFNSMFQLDSHIEIVDLNQTIQTQFNCTKTKVLFNLFSTTICFHDSGKDIYVSGAIRQYKIWEEHLVTNILKILLKNPQLSNFQQKQKKKINFLILKMCRFD